LIGEPAVVIEKNRRRVAGDRHTIGTAHDLEQVGGDAAALKLVERGGAASSKGRAALRVDYALPRFGNECRQFLEEPILDRRLTSDERLRPLRALLEILERRRRRVRSNGVTLECGHLSVAQRLRLRERLLERCLGGAKRGAFEFELRHPSREIGARERLRERRRALPPRRRRRNERQHEDHAHRQGRLRRRESMRRLPEGRGIAQVSDPAGVERAKDPTERRRFGAHARPPWHSTHDLPLRIPRRAPDQARGALPRAAVKERGTPGGQCRALN